MPAAWVHAGPHEPRERVHAGGAGPRVGSRASPEARWPSSVGCGSNGVEPATRRGSSPGGRRYRSNGLFSRHWIEDTQTGQLYRPVFGDPAFCDGVVAYYLRDGSPVMLEPHDAPSLDEIARRRPPGRSGAPSKQQRRRPGTTSCGGYGDRRRDPTGGSHRDKRRVHGARRRDAFRDVRERRASSAPGS
jgi:hypothetical protein